MNQIKNRYTVWLTDDAFKMVDNFYKYDNCSNRSIYIEKAIRFYTGYVASNKSKDYLSVAVSDSVERTIGNFENRMAKMLFKYSVELAIMMNVIAAYHQVDKPEIDKLRGQCVEEVKRTRGKFTFSDAMEWQHGDDDE